MNEKDRGDFGGACITKEENDYFFNLFSSIVCNQGVVRHLIRPLRLSFSSVSWLSSQTHAALSLLNPRELIRDGVLKFLDVQKKKNCSWIPR